MASGAAAHGWIRLVFPRVTSHLREGTASAEKCTAQIFTAMAVFLGNGILSSNALASAAKTVQRPNAKQDAANRFQNDNPSGCVAGTILQRSHLQRCRVDHVGHQQEQNDFEGVLGGHFLSGFSQPSQGHAGHDLGHGNFAAEKGTAPRGVTKSWLETIKETILPSSSGSIDALVSDRNREGCQESLAFFNTSCRLQL